MSSDADEASEIRSCRFRMSTDFISAVWLLRQERSKMQLKTQLDKVSYCGDEVFPLQHGTQ